MTARKSRVTSVPTRTKSTAAAPSSARRSLAVRITGDIERAPEKAGQLGFRDDPQGHHDARGHQRDENPAGHVTAVVMSKQPAEHHRRTCPPHPHPALRSHGTLSDKS